MPRRFRTSGSSRWFRYTRPFPPPTPGGDEGILLVKGAAKAYMSILVRLARLQGVQAQYTDAFGVSRRAGPEALARVLTAMGLPAGTEAQAAASEKALITELSRRPIEPVTVAWLGRRSTAEFAAGAVARGRVAWSLTLESGDVLEGSSDADSLARDHRKGPLGESVATALLPLPKGLPPGYHRLRIEHGTRQMTTTVICSPRRAFRHERGVYEREWGLFCPLYSLRSDRNLGIGDLTDLRELARTTGRLGGRVMATLPMLACFLGERDGPADPSPYAPASRLFWNEVFIDPARTPEFERCAAAKNLMASAEFRKEASALRRLGLVDYARAGALKRRVLELLADSFAAGGGEGSASFKAFLGESPLAREYAAFRAAGEKQGRGWPEWPARMRAGTIRADDVDERARRYHLYVQYAAWLELLALGAEMKATGGLMYLDLPVGVSPFGFDTWKHGGLFAACSTGAPPDPYFTGGQNWGFPPMLPGVCREDGYAYLRACLRAHMRHADYLRLDHVMAFHRLFWIPDGMAAADGVYVRYRDEEMYAILCLESHRGRCRLVGENLGTVPPEVNRALARHDLCGLYVGQYEMRPKSPALRPVPANCVASVNTHDMPPLANTWAGRDIDDRISLKLLDAGKRSAERAARLKSKQSLVALLRQRRRLKAGKSDAASVRDALLMLLAESHADFVLVNIEDLWLEKEWQNVPGTMSEHPNWRRKLRLTLEEIAADGKIASLLRQVDAARRGRPIQRKRRLARR